MVNNHLNEFLKDQKRGERKYLAGAKDNRKSATSNPEYNNNNDTDKSVGASGRIFGKD
jgi:hypothetical protein